MGSYSEWVIQLSLMATEKESDLVCSMVPYLEQTRETNSGAGLALWMVQYWEHLMGTCSELGILSSPMGTGLEAGSV